MQGRHSLRRCAITIVGVECPRAPHHSAFSSTNSLASQIAVSLDEVMLNSVRSLGNGGTSCDLVVQRIEKAG
jgi:hypothetical protein